MYKRSATQRTAKARITGLPDRNPCLLHPRIDKRLFKLWRFTLVEDKSRRVYLRAPSGVVEKTTSTRRSPVLAIKRAALLKHEVEERVATQLKPQTIEKTPLKILQVHNFYGSEAPSGENKVVDEERDLLTRAGHSVTLFSRHSDSIRSKGLWGKLVGGFSTPWNPYAAADLARSASALRPDIVHVHNTFPLISPAAFPALNGKAPRVLTLHNYRLFCAAGIPMREGSICTECLDTRSVAPAMRYRCYRQSLPATLPLAANIALHRKRGTWQRNVDAFIVFSEFQRDTMIAAGLPSELVHIKPNFYDGMPEVLPQETRSLDVVFVGRLTPEKGVHTLIEAWRSWGAAAPHLTLIGDGDQRVTLEGKAKGLPISFLGQLPAEAAVAAIAKAKLLVLPSECFEGFPMVLGEAFAHGTPVAVSDIGPLPSYVEPPDAGITFPPGNAKALYTQIAQLWGDQAAVAKKGANARRAFEAEYTADANLDRLYEIYDAASQVYHARGAQEAL